MKRQWAYACIGVVWLAAMSLGTARAAALYTYTSLRTLGSSIPGAGGATFTNDFEVGTLNAAGVLAFVADFSSGSEGAFLIAPDGTLQVITQPNMDAPGGGKFTGNTFSPFWINDTGNFALGEDVDSGNGGQDEIFYYDAAAKKWTVVLSPGMMAPDAGTFNAGTRYPAIDSANNVAFVGNVADSTAGPAGDGIFLWSPTANKLTTIARPGTKVTSGALSQAWRVAISSSNEYITFEGDVGGSGTYGAYVAKDGVITELATPDTVAPGGTDKFTTLRGPHANSNGDVAMLGQVGDNWGVYLYTAKDKKLTAIVKPGDMLPGGGTLTTVASYRHDIDISDDGSVVFGGQLDDGSGGVYVYKNGAITLVAKTGQNLTGVGMADQLAGSGGLSSVGTAINSKGQIAFTAHTTGDKTHIVLATPAAAPAPAAGQ